MGYVWQRWLADEFRAAGLTVVEVEGWEDRGRPASVGSFEPNGAHTKHHTGTPTSPSRVAPTLATCIYGRPDLPGPLCQWLTAYDGVVYVIAAGRANHAGPIGKSGVPGMPIGGDGNRYALGDEVDTDGTQDIPPAQMRSLVITAAVVARHYDRDEQWTHRHADISGSGKWDIGQLTTPQLRTHVRDAIPEEDPMAQYADQLEKIAADAAAAKAAAEQALKEQRAERKARGENDRQRQGEIRAHLRSLGAQIRAGKIDPAATASVLDTLATYGEDQS